MTVRIVILGGQRIAVDDVTGLLQVSDAPASTFAGGTKAGSTTVATQLIASSTPCRRLWIGPKRNTATDGVVTNTNIVFVGDSAGQNLPIKADGDGVVIAIDDASKIWIRAVVSGEGVDYRILA